MEYLTFLTYQRRIVETRFVYLVDTYVYFVELVEDVRKKNVSAVLFSPKQSIITNIDDETRRDTFAFEVEEGLAGEL